MSAMYKGVITALLLSTGTLATAAPVHQHGLAQAAVVLEGTTLTVSFQAPLMDVLGTERPPADAASRTRYRDRLQQLTAPVPAPAATCQLSEAARTTVDVLFPVSEADHDHDHDHDHQDVEAQWVFQCDTPAALTGVTLPFLATFNSLTTEVVTLLPSGQGAVRLQPGDTRIPLE